MMTVANMEERDSGMALFLCPLSMNPFLNTLGEQGDGFK